MDIHAWIALATLLAAITLFVTRWIPLEATALAIPVILAATGTLEQPRTALVGFGNLAVIAIGAIFIVGGGLKESGVATLMAKGIERIGGRSEWRLLLLIMTAACVLSGFMSSAATVAVFLPVVAVLARRTEIPASHLMLPLGYAAVMGGTLTLIGTTPNLILGEELATRTGRSMGMFEFAKVGVPFSALGILFMVTIGRRLLPDRSADDRVRESQLPEEAAKSYGITKNLYTLVVPAESPLAGQTIAEADIRHDFSLEVVMIRRPKNIRDEWLNPRPDVTLEAGDKLYVEGESEAAHDFCGVMKLEFSVAKPEALNRILDHGVTLAEVTLSPHSTAEGKTFEQLRFRETHGLNVVAIWRRRRPIREGVSEIPLLLGDAFLVTGRPERVRQLAEDSDFVVLTDDSRIEDVRRAPLALALLMVAIVPPMFGWLPLAISAIASALLMVGTGCITLSGAQRSMDFRVLFLIIGTIPLGIALEQQGLAQVMAGAIGDVGATLGTPGTLFILFMLAAILSTTCNNGAAAVILAPVAALVADTPGLGLDPSRAFLAVGIGASCVFALPFGNQCNLMVMGPGGYTAKDFLKAGVGLVAIMAITTVTVLSLV